MAYKLQQYYGHDVENALDRARDLRAGTGIVLDEQPGQLLITLNTDYIRSLVAGMLPTEVPVSSVTLSPTTASLDLGDVNNKTFQLTCTVLPKNASMRDVVWSVTDNSVISLQKTTSTLNSDGIVTNVVTALKAGSSRITAICGGMTASCNVTVADAQVVPTSISLSETSKTVSPGATFRLIPTITPSNANSQTAITWSSSRSSMATVDNNGNVTVAQKIGPGLANTCTITAQTANNKSASCTLTVKLDNVPTTQLTVAPKTKQITPNETFTLSVSRNDNANDNATIVFESSATNIATVSTSGVVQGVSDGQATITAKLQDNSSVYDTCIVTVKTPQTEPNSKILIGDITVGQEIGDALYGDPNGPGEFMTNAQNVSSILTDAIIQQNIDAGNLKEMNLEDVLSTYNKYEDDGGYISMNFATTKSIPIPTNNKFTYHAILIPKSISDDYLPCWVDGVGFGYSFAFPWSYYSSIIDKTVSFNGETYSMSGYYVDMSGANGGYNLTIVKKNQ